MNALTPLEAKTLAAIEAGLPGKYSYGQRHEMAIYIASVLTLQMDPDEIDPADFPGFIVEVVTEMESDPATMRRLWGLQ